MVVYKITNLVNGKIYVGKSVRNPKNYYGSGKLIKQAIKKYGIENFQKEILETCDSLDHLSKREQYWINELNSKVCGYNIADGGTGGDTTSNHPNRQEIIEKRRTKNIGKKRSLEFCELMKKLNKNRDPKLNKLIGQKAALTRKKRISEIGYTDKEKEAREITTKKLVEYNKLESTRQNVSAKLKGKLKKPFTEEHKLNIGKASKGRPGVNKKRISISGTEYESLHKAAEVLNLAITTIRARLLNPKFDNWFYLDC